MTSFKTIGGKAVRRKAGANTGATIRMHRTAAAAEECEECTGGCVQDVAGVKFWDPDLHTWTDTAGALIVDQYTGGRLGYDWYPYLPSAFWAAIAAPVNADNELAQLCDCDGGVSYEWTNLIPDWIGLNVPTVTQIGNWVIVTAGPEQRVDAGTVALTITVCGEEYEVEVVIAEYDPYGS